MVIRGRFAFDCRSFSESQLSANFVLVRRLVKKSKASKVFGLQEMNLINSRVIDDAECESRLSWLIECAHLLDGKMPGIRIKVTATGETACFLFPRKLFQSESASECRRVERRTEKSGSDGKRKKKQRLSVTRDERNAVASNDPAINGEDRILVVSPSLMKANATNTTLKGADCKKAKQNAIETLAKNETRSESSEALPVFDGVLVGKRDSSRWKCSR
jgi:hypothetical protein